MVLSAPARSPARRPGIDSPTATLTPPGGLAHSTASRQLHIWCVLRCACSSLKRGIRGIWDE